jgi:hypothetical protein
MLLQDVSREIDFANRQEDILKQQIGMIDSYLLSNTSTVSNAHERTNSYIHMCV